MCVIFLLGCQSDVMNQVMQPEPVRQQQQGAVSDVFNIPDSGHEPDLPGANPNNQGMVYPLWLLYVCMCVYNACGAH